MMINGYFVLFTSNTFWRLVSHKGDNNITLAIIVAWRENWNFARLQASVFLFLIGSNNAASPIKLTSTINRTWPVSYQLKLIVLLMKLGYRFSSAHSNAELSLTVVNEAIVIGVWVWEIGHFQCRIFADGTISGHYPPSWIDLDFHSVASEYHCASTHQISFSLSLSLSLSHTHTHTQTHWTLPLKRDLLMKLWIGILTAIRMQYMDQSVAV